MDVPARMRAAAFEETGPPHVLRTVDDMPTPAPALSEVLVRVGAAGINPIDAKSRAGGGVSSLIGSWPSVPGFDFSGVVVRSPDETHPLQPGDEVFGMAAYPRTGGTYAEYVVVPSLSVTRKPKSLSHVDAAGVPLAALTAWGLVVGAARAHEGQRILIHAGAGGVGHFAVQLARIFGAHVIATASPRNADFLRELGAHEVVDYTSTRFEDVVSDVDVVIDLIGNVHDDTGTRSLTTLRPGGLYILVPTGGFPDYAAAAAAAGVRGVSNKVVPDGAALAKIAQLIDDGDLRVHVDETFELDGAAVAHAKLEEGHTRGKIVLRVAEL